MVSQFRPRISLLFCLLALLNTYAEAFQYLSNYNNHRTLSYGKYPSSQKQENPCRNTELRLYGKRKVPVQFRGGQGKGGDIQQQRAQFEEIKKTTETMPVFTVLVRHAGGIPKWYPVAGFQGDGNSKAIVDAYIGDGFFSNDG